MYYLFSPLMEDGKQVVRKVEEGDWYEPLINIPSWAVHPTVGKWPILTMKKFEEDPFKEIREAHKQYKPMIEDFKGSDLKLSGFPFIEGFIGLWIAISETIKIVGEVENET